jgi:hypothetical protein
MGATSIMNLGHSKYSPTSTPTDIKKITKIIKILHHNTPDHALN